LFNKADYPQLWGLAQESGLVVSQAQFDAELGALWYVNVSATQFRAPNLLGPNGWGMFPRWAAGGVDADTANAVALGSRKLDTFKGHAHGTGYHVVTLPGLYGANSGGSFASSAIPGTVTGSTGTAETAGRFTAFHPRIHL
jgi:hypothetical protein